MGERWKLLLVSYWEGRTPVRVDWYPDQDEIEEERGGVRTTVARTTLTEDGSVTIRWEGDKSPYPDPMTAKVDSRVRLLWTAQRDGRMCSG